MEQFYVVRKEEKSIDNAGDHPIEVLSGPYKTRADAELWVSPARVAMRFAHSRFYLDSGVKDVYYVAEFRLPEGEVLATKLVSPDIASYSVSQYAGLLHQVQLDQGLEI
jgi:hypothetical protein